MQYAIMTDGSRKEAFKGAKGAICPNCKVPVIPKVGKIKVAHWSHGHEDCLRFSEPETPWHRKWKSYFPESWREVVVGKNHRADIKTPEGWVIEFQHSPISHNMIDDRWWAYGNELIWVLDASNLAKRLEFTNEDESSSIEESALFGDEITLWWKNFSGTWLTDPVQKIFFHFPKNGIMFELEDHFLNKRGRCYGKGAFLTISNFIQRFCALPANYCDEIAITETGIDLMGRKERDRKRERAWAKRKMAINAKESGDWSEYYNEYD